MSYPIIYRTLGSGSYVIDEAGENLGAHKLVYRGPADTWLLADADAVASMPVIGLTLAAIGAGLNGRIMFTGYVGDAAWAWTTGGEAGKIYASTTPGELSQTAPVGAGDVVQVVAVAFFSTGIWFDPAGLGDGGGISELSPETAVVGFNAALAPLVNYFLVSDFADGATAIEAAAAYVGTLGGGSVFLERGTFAGSVTIDEDEVMLVGQGWDSYVNGGIVGHAVEVTGARCQVKDLRVSTTGGATNNYDGISITGADCIVERVWVSDSDRHGVLVNGASAKIQHNMIESVDDNGVSIGAIGDNSIVSNNEIDTTGADGILINAAGETCVVEGNRITAWTGQPIDDNSATSIVRDNNAGGDVVNSNGCGFATIQDAIDDLTVGGWVEVPERTFNEAVLMNNADTILRGRGWDSVIDGGTTGTAITVSGARCVVRDLQCLTTAGATNPFDGIYISGEYALVENVYISASDGYGIQVRPAGLVRITNCVIDTIDTDGIYAETPTTIIGNEISNCVRWGIYLGTTADNTIASNNKIDVTGDDGIYVHANAENCIVEGNRISNWTNEPIDDDSDTSVVTNNNCGGDVMNSKGCAFGTVQASIDHLAGDGWVEVPDGTFGEALVIDEDDVMLRGRSWASIIDGGTTGHAVDVQGTRIIIRDLQVKTTAGQTNAFNGVEITGTQSRIINVYVEQSDNVGVNMNGALAKIENCLIEDCDAQGVLGGATGDDSIVTANQTQNVAGNDIEITANCENCIVTSNRCIAGAIVDNSGTSTVANNDVT